MIKICRDSSDFLNICNKVRELKDIKLTENILYSCMVAGLYTNQYFTYVSYDENKLNGCLVLYLAKDITGGLALAMLFVWIDAHYPKLHKDFIDISVEKAKELGANKVSIITNRKEKIIDRRIGKYEFKKAYSVFEKIIEKEVV